jgi:hypothetical protein
MNPYKAGDVLIDRKTLKRYPIVAADKYGIQLELGSRLVKRALGQVFKHRKKFLHLRKGQMLESDIAFFCPVKNKLIILSAGTVFLGEV